MARRQMPAEVASFRARAARRGHGRVLLAAALATVVLGLASPSAIASSSPVEDLIGSCPSSSEVAAIQADVAITFEADPTAGTLVCHSGGGSVDLTRLQERAYQALRVMKAMHFSRSLPWTSKDLYDWFVGSVSGIRFRDDITSSFCCDPANVINIRASGSAALLTNRWIDPSAGAGLEGLFQLLVHEARHNNGKPHTCGTDDQTVAELGAWGVAYYLQLWEALYTGSFLTSPDSYSSHYRDEHLLRSESTYLPRICSLPTADLSLKIKTPARARAGGKVHYTFTAANAGPDAADDVYLYSPMPAGTKLVKATAKHGSCSTARDGPIACTLGRLPAGASAKATIVLRIDASSVQPAVTNKESATAFGARVTGPVRDGAAFDNSAFFSTPVVRRRGCLRG